MPLKYYIILTILLPATGVVFWLLFTAGPVPDHPYYTGVSEVQVIAHRGGAKLWPENTRLAFRQAVALGVDALEMDIHLTADGIPVVIHDPTVDRTTNGRGAVAALTYHELQALDAGYNWTPDGGQTFPWRGKGLTVPTLEAVLQEFSHIRLIIEMKASEASPAGPLCDLINRYQRTSQVLAASFDDRQLAEFRRQCPAVATSAARWEVTRMVLLSKILADRLLRPAYQSLQIPPVSSGITVVTPAFIRAAQARNLKVEIWTINEAAQMRQYLDWGVNGIITDRPDMLLKLLER